MTIKISKERLCQVLDGAKSKEKAAKILRISMVSLYVRIASYNLQDKYKAKKKVNSKKVKKKKNKIKICKNIELEKNKELSDSNKRVDKLLNRIGTILIKQSYENMIFNKCRKIGIEDNAELISLTGKGSQRILKFRKDGVDLFIPYVYLNANGFPKDIEKFLYNQKIRKSDNNSHLERLRLRLEKEGATLLTTKWQGHKFPYQYKDYQGNIRTMSNSCFFPRKNSIRFEKNGREKLKPI